MHLFECGGDAAAECVQDWPHRQGTFAGQYLFLELCLSVYPVLRKGTLEGVYIHHTVPCEMSGPGEMRADLLVAEPETPPYPLPDGLFAGGGQGHVHPVQGHPVDEPFPLLPTPPGHGVAEGAVVEVEPVWHFGADAHRFRNFRQGLGHFNGVRGILGNGGVAVVVEIIVQPYRHRSGIVGLDDYLSLFGKKREGVGRVGRDLPEDDSARLCRNQAFGQGFRTPDRFRLGCARKHCQKRQQACKDGFSFH